jgi:hypothetical protein
LINEPIKKETWKSIKQNGDNQTNDEMSKATKKVVRQSIEQQIKERGINQTKSR